MVVFKEWVAEHQKVVAVAKRGRRQKGLRRLRRGSQKVTTSFEAQVAAAQAGSKEVHSKVRTFAERNVAICFEFAQKFVHAKNVQEVMQLQAELVKTQLQAIAEQTTELARCRDQNIDGGDQAEELTYRLRATSCALPASKPRLRFCFNPLLCVMLGCKVADVFHLTIAPRNPDKPSTRGLQRSRLKNRIGLHFIHSVTWVLICLARRRDDTVLGRNVAQGQLILYLFRFLHAGSYDDGHCKVQRMRIEQW
jgi:hypothetical protein